MLFYILLLTSLDKFVGYDFPKGYRIRNYDLSYLFYKHKSHDSKIYFLECRNVKRKQTGLLAAMIPFKQYTEIWKKKSTDEGTLLSCDLVVVVDDLVHKESTSSFFVKQHILKKNKSINDFTPIANIHQDILHYFNASSVPVEKEKLVYLNTILGNQYLLHPYNMNQSFLVQNIQKIPSFVEIEWSLLSCNNWFRTCNKDLPALISPF